MSNEKIVTDVMLDKAYVIMAGIIRNSGEKYLPLFKRLHEERGIRKADQDLRAIALKAAEVTTTE